MEEKIEKIPENLDECLKTLEANLSESDICQIKNMTIEEIWSLHSSLGMSIRNEWGLWTDNNLVKWFNEKGIFHADDMSGIVIESFWKKINNHPIELEKQIEEYKKHWKDLKHGKNGLA
jgi:hypothetical protein